MVRVTKPKRQRTQHFIGAWREYKGLTQEQLAGRVEMSRENLSKSDLLERDPRMEAIVDELREIIDQVSEADRKEIMRFAKFRLQIKE